MERRDDAKSSLLANQAFRPVLGQQIFEARERRVARTKNIVQNSVDRPFQPGLNLPGSFSDEPE